MTSVTITPPSVDIIYPSSDGEPMAESYAHMYVLMMTLELLRQYLLGQQATVLGNQFLYYSQGYPKLRVAPDVMVIFNVEPGGRDNYKVWEEGEVPTVIFEMTSQGTKNQDLMFKKTLYEQLGVQEYWLFDPNGEWIENQLQGYRLRVDQYEPITDSRSEPLKLRLQSEGQLIGFYREDTGEKLLIPDELLDALRQAQAERDQVQAERDHAQAERDHAETRAIDAEARATELELRTERLLEKLRSLGINPDE